MDILMTYDLYDLILDLVEAGFTVQFQPRPAENWPYKPKFVSVRIQNGIVASGGSFEILLTRERGEDELVRNLIEFAKYAILKLTEEAQNEPSTTAGSGPTE